MQIIVAPDKFKGSMSASEAAKIIARGISSVLPQAKLLLFPLSDGGEGLVEALTGGRDGKIYKTNVRGPHGSPVEAAWGTVNEDNTAVIEMSAASGLALVPEEQRNPSITTTYGTGELIKAALDRGCSNIIVGIGGSSTNDGGAGMAQALGAKLQDRSGKPLNFGGAELLRLNKIDLSGLDPRLKRVKVMVAGDVDNPLTGPHGASLIYAPQKGASKEMAEKLDRALKKFARVVKNDLGIEVDRIPGAGAAGGLGAGLIAFLGAEMHSGIELVLDILNVDRHLPECCLVITGEGKLDAQSVYGKAPVGVSRRARSHGVPVIALAGSLEGRLEIFHSEGITACFAIADGPLSLEQSISKGPQLLESKTVELMRFWKTALE